MSQIDLTSHLTTEEQTIDLSFPSYTNYMAKNNENQDARESNFKVEPVQEAFMRLSAALLSMSTRVASDMKLNPSEMVALQHLRLDGPLVLGELRKRVSLTSGAMTTLVDRLEKHGLVRREPHPSDRRSILIHYAPQDEQTVGSFYQILETIKNETDPMSEAERSAVLSFLTSLTQTLIEVTHAPQKDSQN